MPYDIKTRSGIVLRNIPDDMPPDAPELKALVQQQLAARAPKPAAPISAADPDEAARMASEGMSPIEKGLVNLGAGFDTFLQGAKQLGGKVGIGPGVSDEEVRDKRERDAALAKTTTGGGVLQVLGEAAPTMLIPAGALGGAALKGAQVASKAAPAAQVLVKALSNPAARGVVDSALSGAVSGALGPVTDDESRLLNAGIGAGFGGAVSGAGSALKKGYGALTQKGAQQRAALMARDAVGNDPAVMRRLQQYAGGSKEIPLTSAAVTQNPQLARMEAGARARSPDQFFDFDQQQAQAVFDKVLKHTDEAAEVKSLQKLRGDEWRGNWETALQVADPAVFEARMQQLGPSIEQALKSPEASNPAVRALLNEVKGEIERVGDGFSPAHLQQIRANLNEAFNPTSANAYASAPRNSAARAQLIQELDDILNATTNGAWDAVKGGYEQTSRKLDAAKAAGRVREAFVDPTTGRIRGVAADPRGEVATVTQSGLSRALDAAREPGSKAELLSQGASQGLNQTLDALRRQNIVQLTKRSATAGGGSNTASDAIASAALESIVPGGSGLVTKAIAGLKDMGDRRRNAVIIEALRDPEAMAKLLQVQARAPGELSSAQRALLQLLRSAGPIATIDEMQAQQPQH